MARTKTTARKSTFSQEEKKQEDIVYVVVSSRSASADREDSKLKINLIIKDKNKAYVHAEKLAEAYAAMENEHLNAQAEGTPDENELFEVEQEESNKVHMAQIGIGFIIISFGSGVKVWFSQKKKE